MRKKFPTAAIFKEAVQLPFKNVGGIFVSIAMFVGASIIVIIDLAVTKEIVGVDPAELPYLLDTLPVGRYGELRVFLVAYLFAAMIMFFSAAHIFNYWVNLAAFGKSKARWSFSEGRFSAAVVNGLKLLLITVLMGLIGVVITPFLSDMGLVSSFEDQRRITDVTETVLATLTSKIIVVVVSCIVYSVFSANLTQTALRSNVEGLVHSHNVGFAVVLMLLYAIYWISTVIAALTGSVALTYIVSLVFVLHLMFTVPIAHGLRYRVCMADRFDDVFT